MGLFVRSGDLTVNDDARLEAQGVGTGYAVEILEGAFTVENQNNVTLIAEDAKHQSSVPVEEKKDKPGSSGGGDDRKPGGSGGCSAGTGAIVAFALLGLALCKKKDS